MSKRSAETQLTKDAPMNSFGYPAGGGGGPDETVEKAKMADPSTLATRKIAPLKKRTRGGARSTGGASIPNVFAAIPSPAFGQGATNGATSPSPATSFNFGGAPTPPASTSLSNGFSFGQPQQEQQKPNPFASLAPASPAPMNGTGGGMFGNTNSGSFGNSTTASTNGMFGNSGATGATTSSFQFGSAPANDKPASSSSFTFGSTNTTTSAPLFGNNTASAPSSGGLFGNNTGASTPPPFTFGATPAAKEDPKPATTGFSFGQAPAKEDPKPVSSGFSFGQPPAATTAADKPAATPSFNFGGASFGKPSTTTSTSFGSESTENKTSAPTFGFGATQEPAKPAATGFSFGASSTNDATTSAPVSSSTATTGGLFGTHPSAAAGSTLFGAKPDGASQPLFGAPVEKTTESAKPAPLFGFGSAGNDTKKEESKPLFGAATTKPEPSSSLFGAPAKKEEPKSLFGTAPTSSFGTQKPAEKEEPKSLFGPPSTSSSGFSFGAPKAPEKPAEKLDFSNPKFGPPTSAKPAEPLKPFSFPATPSFGAPAPGAAPTASAPAPAPAPAPAAVAPASAPAQPMSSAVSGSVTTVTPGVAQRMRSPPQSSDSHTWSANQLTDYYNLFAVRSLNHAFKEELSKQDVFSDLTPLCNAYMAEIKKIKSLMEKNQRYKFGDAPVSAIVPGKRSMEDNDDRSGKRRAMGEDSKAVSSPGKSNSSQALASVLGGFGATKPEDNSNNTRKQSPSIFDNPSPQPTTTTSSDWSSIFKKPDTTNLPDDPEHDAYSSKPEPPKSGGLFDRISPPKDKPISSLFSTTGGDNTWSPDKGFKFGAPATTNGAPKPSLFAPTNGTSASSLFAPKAPSTPASGATSTDASESESATNSGPKDGEPSDAVPPENVESDLAKQGPGEEDEDSLFEIRAIIYDLDARPFAKQGVGLLRVLKNRINGKSRLVARTDLGKVLLNVALSKDVKYLIQSQRLLRIPEFQEGGKIKSWGAKVGREDAAEKLRGIVDEAKGA